MVSKILIIRQPFQTLDSALLSCCGLLVSYCVLLSSGIFGIHLVFGLIIEEEESFVNFFCVTVLSGHFSGEDFVRAAAAEPAVSQGDSNLIDAKAGSYTWVGLGPSYR